MTQASGPGDDPLMTANPWRTLAAQAREHAAQLPDGPARESRLIAALRYEHLAAETDAYRLRRTTQLPGD